MQWDLVYGGWQGSPILEMGVGFRRQVTDDMNPVVGCHYFPPGPQLPHQPPRITARLLVPNFTAW